MCRYNLRTETFADARARTNGLAVASLTMGLVALMIFPLIPLSALGGLLALVMGGAANRQIKESEGTMSGSEMARFGLALGLVAVLVALGLTVAAYLLDVEVINVDLST
jgi:cytochrome c-type biogenesis protein CcmH/NrfG